MTIRYGHGRVLRYRRWGAVAIIVLFGHGLILWGLGLARPQPVERDRSPAAAIVLWRMPSLHAPVRPRPIKSRGRIVKFPAAKAQIAKTSEPVEGGEPPGAPAMSAPASVPDARRALTLALQDHEACVSRVEAGRPIPARCHMDGLDDRVALGPKPDPDLEAAAARVEARLKYKTTPGNSDYWKRVGGAAIDRDLPLCSARPGTYSNAKDQRVWRCWAPDPRNGVAVP